MLPTVVFNFSPGGSDPDEMDHVYGAVPFDAERVWLYTVPTFPALRDVGLMVIPVGGVVMETL